MPHNNQHKWEKSLEDVEKRLRFNKAPEPITGTAPDVALNPFIAGKSLLSLVKRGKGLIKKLSSMAPKSKSETNLITSRFNPNVQNVYNPKTKAIEQIPTEKAQAILKEKGFSDLPLLNMDKIDVPNFGTVLPKTAKGKARENVPYGYINTRMADADFHDVSHLDSKSITINSMGDLYDNAERFYRDNPWSYLIIGGTPGGGRVFEGSIWGELARTSSRGMADRLKFLEGIKADPNYTFYELMRNAQKTIDSGSYYGAKTKAGLLSAVDRVKLMEPFKDRDAFMANPMKSWEGWQKQMDEFYKKGLWDIRPDDQSAIRLGLKQERLAHLTGNKHVGAPFGYEELFTLGDPNNISVKSLDVIRRAGQATKDIRAMQGAIDPSRPELGAGFIGWLEKQMPTLPNAVQSDLRKKFQLGLLPFIAPALMPQDD